jgi:hypothetical protein
MTGRLFEGPHNLARRVASAALTSIKAKMRDFRILRSFPKGRRTMTTETMLIVGAITAAFVGFALTLWWAERQTRDAKRS